MQKQHPLSQAKQEKVGNDDACCRTSRTPLHTVGEVGLMMTASSSFSRMSAAMIA